MVAGGVYLCPGCGSDTIEVIDIEDENMVCENLPKYPINGLWGGMGGLLGGLPVICGGASPGTNPRSMVAHDQCYSYDQGGFWKSFAKLDRPRALGGTFTLDAKLWLTGGKTEMHTVSSPVLESSEFILENGAATQEGMDIIAGDTYFSCSAQLEKGKIFIVNMDGDTWIDHSMIVDPLSHETSSGPTLPRKTRKCEAVSFNSPAHGGRHVVAMLSYGEDAEKPRGSAFLDILDYTKDTPTWEPVKDNIINQLIKHSDGSGSQLLSTPSGDGFIALAGTIDGNIKNIFQFKCMANGCQRIKTIRRLKENHNSPVSMFIPKAITNCRQMTQEEMLIRNQIKELTLQYFKEMSKYDSSPAPNWKNFEELIEQWMKIDEIDETIDELENKIKY